MEIKDSRIDAGKAFDWGRTSKEYAKYRDIYPEKFYRKIVDRGLCVKGQRALDLGTGTGVLPRNLYSYGAEWTGTDISPEQIREAKMLSEDELVRWDEEHRNLLNMIAPERFKILHYAALAVLRKR